MEKKADPHIQRRSLQDNLHSFYLQAPVDTSHPARINDLTCIFLSRNQSRSQIGDENAFDKESDVMSPYQFVEVRRIEENHNSRRGVRFLRKKGPYISQKLLQGFVMKKLLRRKVEQLVSERTRLARLNGSKIRPIKLAIPFLEKNGAEAVVRRRFCRVLRSSSQIRPRLKVKASQPETKFLAHREVGICYKSTSGVRQPAHHPSSALFQNSRRLAHDGDQKLTTGGGVEAMFEAGTPRYSGASAAQIVNYSESMSDSYEIDPTSQQHNRDGDQERQAHVPGRFEVSSLRLHNATPIVGHLNTIDESAFKVSSLVSSENLRTRTGTNHVAPIDRITLAANGTGLSNTTDKLVLAPPYKPQTVGYRAPSVSIVPQNGSPRMRSAARRQTVDQLGSKASPKEQEISLHESRPECINSRRSTFPQSFTTGANPGRPVVNPSVHRQAKKGGGSQANFYAKSWDSVLATKQDFVEDWSSYVQCKRNIEAAADGTDLVSQDSEDSISSPKLDIDLFLQDSEDSIPRCKVDEVRDFCRGVCLGDLLSGKGSSVQRPSAGAWLDDRVCVPGTNGECARDYKTPLDAAKLYEALKVPRIGSADFPDADRRLIYIAGLDPYFVHALAETASFHETLVLRDAIWKHIARQTSLTVRIPSRGIPVYQLEFHLPYFALRLSPPCDCAHLKWTGINRLSQWTDLSFLRLQSPNSNDPKRYVMLEAHISLVICVTDDHRWVAYAFDNTDFEGEDLGEKLSPYGGFCPDPFSSDGEVDANFPIWNPREYFAMILDNRIAQALTEWESLVRAVERSIREYRERCPSTLSESSGFPRGQDEEVQEAFDWTRKTIELLRRLREALSGTITFWKRFNSPNGDVGYFVDNDVTNSSQHQIHLCLRSINDTFETMEDLERTLGHMSRSCQDYAKDLQLLLTKEGSEAAKSTGATSDFSLFVLGPIVLAATVLQLPQTMLPLPPGPQSFVILTFAIMVVMKLLHLVSSAIPGFQWWWKVTLALMKTIRLEGMGFSFSLGSCGRLMRHVGHRYNDRNMSNRDVEMGRI